MRTYETTFIIDPLLKDEKIETTLNGVVDFILKNGGEDLTIDKWGKKRLAYEIEKKQYGYYVNIVFKAPGGLIVQLERHFKLNNAIFRYLTLSISVKKAGEVAAEKTEEEKPAEAVGVITEEPALKKTEVD